MVLNGAGAFLREFRPLVVQLALQVLLGALTAGGAAFLATAESTPFRMVGLVLAVAGLIATFLLRKLEFTLGDSTLVMNTLVPRVLLLVAVGAGFAIRTPGSDAFAWAGVAVAAILLLAEPVVDFLSGRVVRVATHLPGVPSLPDPPFPADWLALQSLSVTALGGVLAALRVPGWIFAILVLLTVPAVVIQAWYGARLAVLDLQVSSRMRKALEKYAPKFVVYYAAVNGARYQLGMWLPYLERLNQPYVVITRNPATVPVIAELTKAPILVPRGTNVSGSLDKMVVPSMKAAFYVQGSAANQTFQRYRALTHVWLNHGDSDKPANFHPRHATYDKLFVSGQQGIERYANHGIAVQPHRFQIVGRPQIEDIEVRDEPVDQAAARTVLYAPTWKGGRPSTNFSSLRWGAQMVQALVDRGSTVIFRPHPLSYVDATERGWIEAIHAILAADKAANGRQHVWGEQSEKVWDIPACFNHSDALITDVSSVASDFLASGKPLAMVAVRSSGDAFRKDFPMAQVAYVIEKDMSTLDAALDGLHGADTLAEERRAYRSYCLGEHVGPRAADEFLAVAGRLVTGQKA